MMPASCQKSILLTTLNARYTHSAIGLRYLFANMAELKENTAIREFIITDNVQDIAERLLSEKPAIIGIGVYIWNALLCAELVGILKKVSPRTIIILGGPEVSYAPFRVNFDAADYLVQGEGDTTFYHLCKSILTNFPPTQRIIQSSMADLKNITLPYDDYLDEDIANRYIYIEASRGCPFSCEFCLSSIDKKVRDINTATLLTAMEKLWQRGVRSFKFIDRTFNLNVKIASQLLDFFLSKEPPYFVHFEVIPDHFPDALKERIKRFPPASLQLEIGIQTLNTEVADRIQRNLKMDKIKENIRFLEEETSAHMHLDLIIGLPGESLASFGDNLNRLYAMTHSEIQIGILKKLSGTNLHRHDANFNMVYSDQPPYDILKSNMLSFEDIQHMKRFSRFWNLYYNSGNFKTTMLLLAPNGEIFEAFDLFSRWVYQQTQRTWQISLNRLTTLIFDYLTQELSQDEHAAAKCLIEDIDKRGSRKMPGFLQPFAYGKVELEKKEATGHNKRQMKHL